jgi:hypothetical protein
MVLILVFGFRAVLICACPILPLSLPFYTNIWKTNDLDHPEISPLEALKIDKSAMKSLLSYHGQVLARVKAHLGSENWPADRKAPSPILKTSSSSSAVIAVEAVSAAAESDKGIDIVHYNPSFCANRSPLALNASTDSPNVPCASTVREIASKSDEGLNGSSVNISNQSVPKTLYLPDSSVEDDEDTDTKDSNPQL